MCDKRLTTSFNIEDIIAGNDKSRRGGSQPEVYVPVVVRPWEMEMANRDETCWRRLTAALTLCHWQAISSVSASPLCALYRMTSNSFTVGSLNNDHTIPGSICRMSLHVKYRNTTKL